MSVVRGLERRLERLLEGVAGRVFSSRLHPAEIAGRLAREADFARFDHDLGPATANAYTLMVNAKDLATDSADLESSLATELLKYTFEHGLRLEGPCRVAVVVSDRVAPGKLACHAEVVPGQPEKWARLVADHTVVPVRHNRALVGRAEAVDVPLPHEEVSRHHAVIWQEGGRTWIRDLGSANGTTVDGTPITDRPTPLEPGAAVSFAGHRYRWSEEVDA